MKTPRNPSSQKRPELYVARVLAKRMKRAIRLPYRMRAKPCEIYNEIQRVLDDLSCQECTEVLATLSDQLRDMFELCVCLNERKAEDPVNDRARFGTAWEVWRLMDTNYARYRERFQHAIYRASVTRNKLARKRTAKLGIRRPGFDPKAVAADISFWLLALD
ncbi:MAG: hypothetical protein U1F98_06280 [Verrucomicrobiota bacterium]